MGIKGVLNRGESWGRGLVGVGGIAGRRAKRRDRFGESVGRAEGATASKGGGGPWAESAKYSSSSPDRMASWFTMVNASANSSASGTVD